MNPNGICEGSYTSEQDATTSVNWRINKQGRSTGNASHIMELKIDNDSARPRPDRPVISGSVRISPFDAALVIAAIHRDKPLPMDEKAWMIDVLTYGSKQVLEAAA